MNFKFLFLFRDILVLNFQSCRFAQSFVLLVDTNYWGFEVNIEKGTNCHADYSFRENEFKLYNKRNDFFTDSYIKQFFKLPIFTIYFFQTSFFY